MRVYVAGAINADNIISTLNNIKQGIAMGAKLIRMGYSPFIPHLDYQLQFFEDLTIEQYYKYSIAWLKVADIVLVLPNSENSKGTQAEIVRAKELGIPVVYNLDELEKCCANLGDNYSKKYNNEYEYTWGDDDAKNNI